MKRLQQNMQVFPHKISNAFQMMSQMFHVTYSTTQPVHNTLNYHVFPNYSMNETLNTLPVTSHNSRTFGSQDLMKHIFQLEMESGEVIQATKTKRKLTLMKKMKRRFVSYK